MIVDAESDKGCESCTSPDTPGGLLGVRNGVSSYCLMSRPLSSKLLRQARYTKLEVAAAVILLPGIYSALIHICCSVCNSAFSSVDEHVIGMSKHSESSRWRSSALSGLEFAMVSSKSIARPRFPFSLIQTWIDSRGKGRQTALCARLGS